MPAKSESSENNSVQDAAGNAAPHHFLQQIEYLHGRVAALEKELAASQAKCQEYRQFVLQWLSAQHSAEELEKFALDDDETHCQPLAQFIGELEAMLYANKKGD